MPGLVFAPGNYLIHVYILFQVFIRFNGENGPHK